MHHNARGYAFLWFSASVCFFNIKFYVSSSRSYCWAIRPPTSFSFFLCPFSLHPPYSAPTLVLSLFSACFSLSLPYLSLFLSGFLLPHFSFTASFLSFISLTFSLSLCLSLFPASLSPPLSLSSLSLLPSHSLSLSEGTRCWWLKSSFRSLCAGLSFHLRQVTLS